MNFFHKESKSKKKYIYIFFFFFGGGGGGGAGVDRWMDSQTGPYQFVPLTSSKLWGHNNALIYMLCP